MPPAASAVALGPIGLVGQGFTPPDFNLKHLLGELEKLSESARHTTEAANGAYNLAVTAGNAADQLLRTADRIVRLPTDTALPSQAFGDLGGRWPPKAVWQGLAASPSGAAAAAAVCACVRCCMDRQRLVSNARGRLSGFL
eukprot:TRINITY_DN125390_c0_g1_i1.p1 TRINITY_DN125390_c0_g1~~TRINITY_DN125390_c0_g1_i1.p1  ORF type:complete len:141 (-),score=27.08 TRINITY_DN125390_c0_g1_i1:193-615(-)